MMTMTMTTINDIPSRPHWREYLPELRERLANFPRILVASDFDGTLSPLVDQRESAVLETGAEAVLAQLATLRPKVKLAFLSGRGLEDLTPRLGLSPDQAVFAGNHGLEIRGARMDWTHPARFVTRADLEVLIATISKGTTHLPGVELEDKGASLSLHYRQMAMENEPELREFVSGLIIPETVRTHEGKMVFEFRPSVEWNKGFAIRHIIQRLGLQDDAVIFLGDDVTDEDVFRELGTTAFTIHVGPSDTPSHARLNADDPADVVEFLESLVNLLKQA